MLVPRRSNDFQHLIKLIHESLAPVGATVTESNMVYDADTGDLREVDITVTVPIGDDETMLVIECRDHKRSQTVEWIEQLIGKFQDRSGRAIIAVSRSGFTSAARRKALRHQILALSVEDATDTDWLADVKAYPKLTITVTNPVVRMVDAKLVDKSVKTEDLPPLKVGQIPIFGANGRPLGTATDIYDALDRADALDQVLFQEPRARRPDGSVELGIRMEPGAYLIAAGIALELEGIVFVVDPNEERIELDVKAGKYGSADVATAIGRTKSWRFQFVVVRGQDGSPKISLSVQPTKGQLPDGVMTLYGVPG